MAEKMISGRFLAVFFCGLFLVSGVFSKSDGSIIRKGNKAYKKSDYDGALENYLKVCEKSHPDIRACYNAGNASYKMQRFKDAQKYYKKAAPKKDYSHKALFNLANSHFLSGNLKKAEEIYRNMITQNPKDKKAKYNLQVLLKQKRDEKQNKKKQQKKDDDEKSEENKPSMSKQDAMRLLEIAAEKELKNMQTDAERNKSKNRNSRTPRGVKDW